jgi:hypothetical protein
MTSTYVAWHGRGRQINSCSLGHTYVICLPFYAIYMYYNQTSLSSSVSHRLTHQLELSFIQRVAMAVPSRRKNLSAAAAVILLLVTLAAGTVPVTSYNKSLTCIICVHVSLDIHIYIYIYICRAIGMLVAGWLPRAPERRL